MKKTPDRISEYVTMQEAAEMKQITRATLYYAVQTGKLQSFKQLGRTVLLRSEVETFQPAGYLDRRPSKSNRKKTEVSE